MKQMTILTKYIMNTCVKLSCKERTHKIKINKVLAVIMFNVMQS